MKTSKSFVLLVIFLAIGAAILGWASNRYLQVKKQEALAKVSALIYPQAREINAFKLVNEQKTFTHQNFQGHWSLLFFGFTHCPVICPTTLSTLNQAYNKLKNDHFQPLPQIIFISVDPERDNPDRVSQYAAGFNPDFIGLTGEKAQIDQLAKNMNAMYVKVELKPTQPGDKPAYTIDHTTSVMLVDPNGKFRAVFASPESGDKFAQDYETVIKSLDE